MNTTTNQPLESLTILTAAVAHVGKVEGVSVWASQNGIDFTARRRSDKTAMLAAKRAAGTFLAAYPHRRFRHATARNNRLWLTDSDNLRCGIDIVLTEDETRSICLGPIKGHNY